MDTDRGYITDRRGLAAAHGAGQQDLVDSLVRSVALECREDLLETAAVLDALALCHGQGSPPPPAALPGGGRTTTGPGVGLRTDARPGLRRTTPDQLLELRDLLLTT